MAGAGGSGPAKSSGGNSPSFSSYSCCCCFALVCEWIALQQDSGCGGWGGGGWISTGQQLSVHAPVGGASSIVSAKPGGLFVHFFVCFLLWALGAETLSSRAKLLSHLFVDCEPLIVS